MQSLTFTRTNGNVPKTLPGEDHISGLIAYPGTLPTGFTKDEPVQAVSSIETAEKLAGQNRRNVSVVIAQSRNGKGYELFNEKNPKNEEGVHTVTASVSSIGAVLDKILLILFLFGLIHTGKAQYTGTYTATPEAATVMKNIDFPATNHTGIVNTTIPLYEANLSDFKLDISLNYAARGIQVEEVASNVGLGWSLNAGGMITRAVSGEPDDFNKTHDKQHSDGTGRFRRVGRFWTKTTEKIKDITPTSTNFNTIETQLKNVSVGPGINGYSYHGVFDLEPDMFYFSCNGISGQFVFDVKDNGTQTIKLIPYQDVKITHTLDSNGEIHSFTMTDFNGNTYFFNDRERIARQEERISVFWNNENYEPQSMSNIAYANYNSTWYLSKVTTKTNQTITFDYANEVYAAQDMVLHYTRPWSKYLVSSSSGLNETSTKKRISKITTPHETIIFSPQSTERQDVLRPRSYAIGKVEVKSNVTSDIIKSFDFVYDYFVGKKESNFRNAEKRLKLASLKESEVGTHIFKYNAVAPPDRYSNQQDFWGFYNGQAGNKDLLPSIWYYPNKKGSERFSIYSRGTSGLEWAHTGSNRTPNESYIQAGILTNIIHPHGGKTEFAYEMNSFTYDGAIRSGGGIRIKNIKKYDHQYATTPVIEQHYSYITGKIITMPVLGYFRGLSNTKGGFVLFSKSLAQPGTTNGGFVGYEKVSVREGSATGLSRTEYYYYIPATYGDESEANVYYASKTYVTGLSNVIGNPDKTNITGMNVYPFPPHPNFDFYRGHLLSKKIYDKNDKLKKEISYGYKFYYPNSAIKPYVVHGLKFFTSSLFFDNVPVIAFLSRYEILTEVGCILMRIVEKNCEDREDFAFTETTFISYSKTHMNPIEIKRSGIQPDHSFVTKYKYVKDYNIFSGNETKGITSLVDKNINSLIEKTDFIVRGSNEYLTSATINMYNGSIYPYATGIINPNSLISDFKPSTTQAEPVNLLQTDPRYKIEKQYEKYGSFGNCLEIKDKNDVSTVILWSYKGKYPIAVIRNATYEEVTTKLGGAFLKNLPIKASPTGMDFINIRKLRVSLPKSEVTTYTYKHLIGLIEVNDPRGISTFYDYTGTRLKEIYTKDKNAAGQEIKQLHKSFNYDLYKLNY